jgi:hypothetical protein
MSDLFFIGRRLGMASGKERTLMHWVFALDTDIQPPPTIYELLASTNLMAPIISNFFKLLDVVCSKAESGAGGQVEADHG